MNSSGCKSTNRGLAAPLVDEYCQVLTVPNKPTLCNLTAIFTGRSQYKKYVFVSDEGKIHKIVQWTRNGDSQSALLDIFDVTPGEPIQVRKHYFKESLADCKQTSQTIDQNVLQVIYSQSGVASVCEFYQ